jgi:DMSO reductase anchor subunit
MNPAYSVILFTTASGAGYGLLGLLGLVGYNHGQASSLGFGLTSMVIALGLITVGLLSSTLHLGHPERAWRAFSQWRTSWLSREGVAAVLTYIPAFAFGLIWSGLVEAPQWIAPLGLVTAVLCAVTVLCTGQIYASLKTIRAWAQPLTTPVYLAFALATGATLLAAIATVFGRFQTFLGVFCLVALALTGSAAFEALPKLR